MLEDKESTRTFHMIVMVLSVLTMGAFAALFFFAGDTLKTEPGQRASVTQSL